MSVIKTTVLVVEAGAGTLGEKRMDLDSDMKSFSVLVSPTFQKWLNGPNLASG